MGGSDSEGATGEGMLLCACAGGRVVWRCMCAATAAAAVARVVSSCLSIVALVLYMWLLYLFLL